MLKIAICDDEAYIVDTIERYLLDYDKEEVLDFQVYKYYDGETLVKSNLIFDLVFLDIVMKDMDGIETGTYLKNRNMKTQIVYITNFSDYSLNAHSIHAFDYIIKPVEYSKLASILRDFKKLNSDTDSNSDIVRLKNENGDEILLNTDDVIYFLYDKSRKLIVRTCSEHEITIRGTLYEIYEKLNQEKFAQPHRAYIINLNYVKTVKKAENGFKDVYMKDGSMVPLSQRKQKEFSEKMHKYART